MSQDQPNNIKLRLAVLAIPILGISAANIYQMIDDPNVTRPAIKVFGPSPLGLPPGAVVVLVMSAFVVPLAMFVWQAARLARKIHELEGRVPLGRLETYKLVRKNWVNPEVRTTSRRALSWLAAFALIVGAWIAATSYSGA